MAGVPNLGNSESSPARPAAPAAPSGSPVGGVLGGSVAPLAPVAAPVGYGPSALATPANFLTLVRLLAAPILVIMIYQRPTAWLTWAVWTALAGTDGIDGWLARRHGTTRSGAFLDPLADKFLVLGAMFALVANHRFWWLPVAVIAVREMAIVVYRIVVARHGVSVPARALAKLKTLVQAVAISAVVLPPTGHHLVVALVALWIATGLTVVTGVQYFAAARRTAPAGPAAGPAAV